MSRVGGKPIPIPKGVEVKVEPTNRLTVKGPKGTLTYGFHQEMRVLLEDGSVRVERPSDERRHKALHGLTRALINNMVVGVTEGYQRALEIVGVGYRAQQSGNKVVLQVGLSHPVEFEPPPDVQIAAEGPNRLVVRGCDKQHVSQVAAELRKVRPPDRYKGKGIRYAGEEVHLKPGKAAARKQ
jgi:large subunit ribosomal protein L6